MILAFDSLLDRGNRPNIDGEMDVQRFVYHVEKISVLTSRKSITLLEIKSTDRCIYVPHDLSNKPNHER